MKLPGIKVLILAVSGLVMGLVVGPFGNTPSLVLAQGPTAKVRPVERIAADAPRFVPGQVLARFRADLPEPAIEALLKTHGARTLSVSRITGHRRIAVPPGMPEEVFLQHLTALPDVVAAQLNHTVYAFDGPNDPDFGLQWHYTAPDGGINVVSAWGTFAGVNQVNGYNGSGVTVAVIDTGLAYKAFPPIPQAPEWAGQQDKVVLPLGVDMDRVNADMEPNDDHGHGTHVSNTISQNTNNGFWGAGVANGAKIMPIKVLDASGSGEELALAEAIRLAADYGADVINMSLGFPTGTQASELPLLAAAVTYAYNKGVTIVAAAGNDAAASCSYPAAFPEVICVGATKYDGNLAWYSNHGTDLELVAPGGANCASADDLLCQLLGYPYYYNDQNGDKWPDGILQETFGPDYTFDDWFYEGTSMASPHVAAVAALVIGKARGLGLSLTPDEVRQILKGSARDKGEPGYDSTYGWGLVDAYAALMQVVPSPSPTPNAPSSLTATAISTSQINLAWTDNATDETGFKIERCLTSSCTFAPIATVGANVPTYQNTGLTANTSYSYRVRAYNDSGDSEYSNVATATTPAAPVLPSAPINLIATAVSRSQINLAWTDTSNNETGFKIERCAASKCTNFTEITTVGASVTTYSNTGLSSNTTYRYRVRAYNATGNSAYSNIARATTKRR